ncbi:MAG TPA: polysaccharide pyruvyl transferase family protein [Caulobacteraceae bacterium]|jgi:hypothetical protein
MPAIAFAHIRRSRNVGDLMCCPGDYFDFGDAAIFDVRDEIPQCDAVIYGGGAIEQRLRVHGIHRNVQARVKAAWGIGTSVHGKTAAPEVVQDMDLVGVRELGRAGTVYTPCVSCMHPIFDEQFERRHEAVLFFNADKKIPRPEVRGLPELRNVAGFEETVEFLASGDVVVTNSFHGVYWATLLGRRVVCLPYSSKFYGFRFPPAYATAETALEAIAAAPAHPEALADCRRESRAFHKRVADLIGAPVGT